MKELSSGLWHHCFLFAFFSFLFLIFAMASSAQAQPLVPPSTYLLFSIPFLLLAAILGTNAYHLQKKKLTELIQQKASVDIQRKQYEADELTSLLRNILQSSTAIASQLPHILADASYHLQTARSEFAQNAFDPFWTEVERAAQYLYTFKLQVEQLSKNADLYYSKLRGRNHTFPIFPVRRESLPDPTPLLEELRTIVRLGQTNIDFATILQHRRTREVLIAGFRSLGELVDNLGRLFTDQISSLKQFLASDIARIVEEELQQRQQV